MPIKTLGYWSFKSFTLKLRQQAFTIDKKKRKKWLHVDSESPSEFVLKTWPSLSSYPNMFSCVLTWNENWTGLDFRAAEGSWGLYLGLEHRSQKSVPSRSPYRRVGWSEETNAKAGDELECWRPRPYSWDGRIWDKMGQQDCPVESTAFGCKQTYTWNPLPMY